MGSQLLGVIISIVMMTATVHADLKCGGTEPFWSLMIGAKKAVYETMEGSKTTFDAITIQEAEGIKAGHVRKYQFKNTQSSADAVVLKKKCDDGMSDITYPYNITLTIAKTVLSGCCR